ncbi:glycoside hydrolase family 13 protein [Tunturibacter empetritectus]|uniref:Alpha-glucosidase n=1 Tax=Tunturiibacter lichenicola TaxID=2051959 RepID=A0A7W8J4D0_9BACT|nr:alpha-glucosidase [Edaphobacter lichenicola]MBB5342435.1 alpha-glucosidase [Edaphobacter lichenicola]
MNETRLRTSIITNHLLCAALALGTLIPSARAQSAAQQVPPAADQKNTTADPWWKHGVIYEIYPRSFQDTDGDGIGDIKGITSRLDYIKQLGIDAIWITPMYPSPQIDFGYDIADYTAIDPQYGTMADFEHMTAEAKRRNIRVIMDYVPNHTSDQSVWFKESRSSRTNPKRDWYIWRDPKGFTADGKPIPPNNWQSWFGHSAWEYDSTTKQFYYHHFYVQQPDLNWRNPEVVKAMMDVLRFWMDKGVNGFRVDAVSRLFEDPNLHDDPILPGTNAFGDPNIVHKYTDNLPEVHDMLREMRKVVDQYPGNPVLISEADEPNIFELSKMYGANNDEVQLPMDFQVADVNELNASKFRELLKEVENNPAHGQPYFFFGNHDQDRIWDRYSIGFADPAMKARIARMMATLLLTSRGTPQMYYGDEIGMVTTTPTRVEDVRDPEGITGWPKQKGRDGERTPMQWNDSKNAGFSTAAATWLPVAPNYKTVNVAIESPDHESMLNWYKRLIELRRTNPALYAGSMTVLNPNEEVLSYLRQGPPGKPSVLVALNFSGKPQTLHYDYAALGLTKGATATLETNDPSLNHPPLTKPITLAPYATWIAEVQ